MFTNVYKKKFDANKLYIVDLHCTDIEIIIQIPQRMSPLR